MAVTADSEKEKNLFPPVDRFKMAALTRLYESIIADISDRISRGVLKPGDILPSERELAEQFQLSRIPVREALKILEPREKAVIVLRFFEDQKLEDIARTLQENTNTVKTILYRSLKKLRVELTEGELLYEG